MARAPRGRTPFASVSIMAFLVANPQSNYNEICCFAESAGIPVHSVSPMLRQMVLNGVLSVEGEVRSYRYVVTAKYRPFLDRVGVLLARDAHIQSMIERDWNLSREF